MRADEPGVCLTRADIDLVVGAVNTQTGLRSMSRRKKEMQRVKQGLVLPSLSPAQIR